MQQKKTTLTVCYFGIYDPDFSCNSIYIRGLKKNGVNVIECRDTASGFRKYLNLFLKHRKLRNEYDIMIVGYPGHIIVPFAKLIARKKVVFDALCSFYESEILSRDAHANVPFRSFWAHLVDRLANYFSDYIIVETKKQKNYFVKTLGVPEKKVFPLYLGANDEKFFYDPTIEKSKDFTVLFRGRINEESGVRHIIEAARLLRDQPIKFIIVGFGFGRVMDEARDLMEKYNLPNLSYVSKQLPLPELRAIMLSSHISLGQFENHSRLEHTIPHKAFESLAMRLPYLTARTGGVLELLEDGKTCLYSNPADPADLANKILFAYNHPETLEKITQNGEELFRSKLSPSTLGIELAQFLLKIIFSKQ